MLMSAEDVRLAIRTGVGVRVRTWSAGGALEN